MERNNLIDWQAAAEAAEKLCPPGPTAPRAELEALVASLRASAVEAIEPAVNTAGLDVDTDALGRILVVDRSAWAASNARMMAAMTEPVAEVLTGTSAAPNSMSRLVGALEVGAMLATLSPRVLGQYDPYSDAAAGPDGPSGAGGKLMLVAPNVLATGTQMKVDPADFRLWICLHEQTHAIQFTAAPWLAEHLKNRLGSVMAEVAGNAVTLSESTLRQRLAHAWRMARDLTAGIAGKGTTPPFEALMTSEQRAELAELTAIMALLEGHADVIMDDVGPKVIPTVAQIRARFERRRDGQGSSRLTTLLGRLTGMDSKLAQYRDGAVFVRAVETAVGRDGLNAIWSSPDTLPSAADIKNPAAWVARVHG